MKRAVAEKWIRTPSDEAALAEGCWFDESAGARVATFFERFLRHSKGKFASKPFTLIPWQRDLVDRMYGWKRPDRTRRFREGYVEIPKKNGKSTTTAGLELYHLVADGEPGAEVYTGARDRQQASIIYNEACSMIEASPELARRLEIVRSAKRVIYPAARSFMQALSADVGSKEGLNASFTCIDELHVQPSPALYHTLRYAGAAREQPLLFTITTAGEDLESICYQLHETALQVTNGALIDTSFLGIVYAAAPDDDFEDPAVWRKANPSLGYTLNEEAFARDLQSAKRTPSEWASFLRYRLNLWLGSSHRFLPLDAWNACGLVPVLAPALHGRSCHAGLDLAATTDLAAFAAVFPDNRVLMRFWKPAASLLEHSRRDRVDYRAWERAGLLVATPGAVIDFDRILSDLVEFHGRHPIAMLGADPWNATQLCTRLTEQHGIPAQFVRQGFASLSAPTKELERLVLQRELRHGTHPLLNWQADNACAVRDSNDNVRLDKKTSRKRIDGMSALVNALAVRIAAPVDSGPSVYESRGLLYL